MACLQKESADGTAPDGIRAPRSGRIDHHSLVMQLIKYFNYHLLIALPTLLVQPHESHNIHDGVDVAACDAQEAT
jgi:hypothetical protein